MTASRPRAPRAPAGLQDRSRRLWVEIVRDYDLRVDELRLLEEACHEVDLVDRMEALLADAPTVVPGSRGQDTAHPLLAEIRAHRLVLSRLFRALKLPDEATGDGVSRPAASRSTSARAAANARWGRNA